MKQVASLVFALTILATTGSARAQELYGTLKKIKDSGAITIGFRESSTPFSSYDQSGKAVGYSIDLCLRIADEVKSELKMPNLEVKFTAVNPQTRIPLLANGTVDLECGSTTNTFTRQQQVDFLYTMFVTGANLTVRKDAGIKDIEDIAGKVVGIPLGSTNERTIKAKIEELKLANVRLVNLKDHAEGMLALETGRIDAYCNDEVVSYGLMAKSKAADQLAVVGRLLSFDPYGIMVRRDDSAFRMVGNRALASLFRTGEIKTIYKKWFDPLNVPLSNDLEIVFKTQAIPN